MADQVQGVGPKRSIFLIEHRHQRVLVRNSQAAYARDWLVRSAVPGLWALCFYNDEAMHFYANDPNVALELKLRFG